MLGAFTEGAATVSVVFGVARLGRCDDSPEEMFMRAAKYLCR